MVKLEFSLLNKQVRTVFLLFPQSDEYTCLIDTGAQTPVFCKGVHHFLDFAEPFGKVTEEGITEFYGFGKEPIAATIFCMEDFALTDDANNCIHFKNFKVLVVDDRHYEFDLILPAPMFKKTKYSFDYTQDPPLLTIESPKNTYYTNFLYENGPLYMFLTDQTIRQFLLVIDTLGKEFFCT